MTTSTIRAALTETRNVYQDMPTSLDQLSLLENCLREIREANVNHHLELIAAAAAQGCELIGLGELFPGPYFALNRDPIWLRFAEDAETGPTVSALRAAAKSHQMVIVAPIYELDGSRRFNTTVIIDGDGTVLGHYRKTHIPSGQNESGEFDERYYYEAGDGTEAPGGRNLSRNPFFPVFATRAGNLGIATCYDRHFEGVMRTLALEGAQIVLSPAVTFGAKSRRLWPQEFASEAAHHNIFIGASNRKGKEPPWDIEFFGESHFVGPNGTLPDLSNHPNLIISDITLEELTSPDPAGWNLPRDTRPDIYS